MFAERNHCGLHLHCALLHSFSESLKDKDFRLKYISNKIYTNHHVRLSNNSPRVIIKLSTSFHKLVLLPLQQQSLYISVNLYKTIMNYTPKPFSRTTVYWWKPYKNPFGSFWVSRSYRRSLHFIIYKNFSSSRSKTADRHWW